MLISDSSIARSGTEIRDSRSSPFRPAFRTPLQWLPIFGCSHHAAHGINRVTSTREKDRQEEPPFRDETAATSLLKIGLSFESYLVPRGGPNSSPGGLCCAPTPPRVVVYVRRSLSGQSSLPKSGAHRGNEPSPPKVGELAPLSHRKRMTHSQGE